MSETPAEVHEDLVEATCTPPEDRSPEVEALLALPDDDELDEDERPRLQGLLAATATAHQTLRDRGNLWGVATRPEGSDDHPPPPGTRVTWVVAQPVQDMLDQGRALGWGNAGTIGDVAHLRKHGDHTPWSAGKTRGIVYAKDTNDPAWLEAALITLCRREDYDTRWIHFWNCNGSQYNYTGQRVASSNDHHLHVSVRAGWELHRTTLFRDLDRYHRGLPLEEDDVTLTPTQARQLADIHWSISSAAAGIGHPFQVDRKNWTAKLDAILAELAGDDTETIVAAIREQGDRTRAALLARMEELAPGLAAEVVEHIGENTTAEELADLIVDKTAERLAGTPTPDAPES